MANPIAWGVFMHVQIDIIDIVREMAVVRIKVHYHSHSLTTLYTLFDLVIRNDILVDHLSMPFLVSS